MRPRYETASDLVEEEDIVSLLCEMFGKTYRKLPVSYGLDFALMSGDRISSFIECKSRRNAFDKYPTIMVSGLKIMKARELSAAFGVNCLFVIRWTDKLGYVDLCSPDWLGWGGRTDRNDPADMEPVAHFDLKKNFTSL